MNAARAATTAVKNVLRMVSSSSLAWMSVRQPAGRAYVHHRTERKMAYMDKVQELIEAPLSREELAMRYRALCDDPLYANLPGKIELDVWGRMVMTPPSYYHGVIQGRLCQRLAVLGG